MAVGVVGVPEMTPDVLFNERPAGKAGLTVKLSTEPVTVGVLLVMAVLTVYTAGFDEYDKFVGAARTAFTVMLTEAVVIPALFFAVTV